MRKLLACLVLVGASLFATTSPASTEPLPCHYICCNESDGAAECTWAPFQVTNCQTWWSSGTYCP